MSVTIHSHVSKHAPIQRAVTSVVVTVDMQWMEICALVGLLYTHTDIQHCCS